MSEQLPRVDNNYLRYYYPDSAEDIVLLKSCGLEFKSLTELNSLSLRCSIPRIYKQLVEGTIIKKGSLEILKNTFLMADLNNSLYPEILDKDFNGEYNRYSKIFNRFNNIDNLKSFAADGTNYEYVKFIKDVLGSCKRNFKARFIDLTNDMEYLKKCDISYETYQHVKYAAKTVGRLSVISSGLINYLEDKH
jgi:hypothetical protein